MDDSMLPLGERVRALEVGFDSITTQLERRLGAIETDQRRILLALERRSAAIRIAGWFVRFAELLLAAIVGGEWRSVVRLVGG